MFIKLQSLWAESSSLSVECRYHRPVVISLKASLPYGTKVEWVSVCARRRGEGSFIFIFVPLVSREKEGTQGYPESVNCIQQIGGTIPGFERGFETIESEAWKLLKKCRKLQSIIEKVLSRTKNTGSIWWLIFGDSVDGKWKT